MARHTIEIADSESRELEEMARREGISARALLANMIREGWRLHRERLLVSTQPQPAEAA